MKVTKTGLLVDMKLEDGYRIPKDSPVQVHNLSAGGEQYIDFLPEDGDGPYADEGYTFRGTKDSLPVGEDEVLIKLDAFVNSVDKDNLSSFIKELGAMFKDTGRPLQKLIDSGSEFIDVASAHTQETLKRLDTGLKALVTQQGQAETHTAFSRHPATPPQVA